ncbi:S41 family peptidase [Trebonia kvetii]|uniref:S41 family peptidase n=1 Tax=Trebonia kvetii TaxID=2480626 RepID=UPI001652050C|nr:S41 family peptidase [Trebonia kvetii]
MAAPGYLRFPHIHGDLLTFVAEDDVWLAPADGGRAWRLTADGGQASHPRFAPDGAAIAWTSWRDGGIPEVYTADTDGGTATGTASRRTYWGDLRTRVTGWTSHGEVLAVTAFGEPSSQRTMAYAVPLDAPPRRLPFGQVSDLALTESATALLTAQRGDPSAWKRYRGGTAGRLWVATADDPLFTRVLSGLNGQLAAPMLIDGRLVFLSDHEGTGNIYSVALDGGDLRRHTDHDGFYARNPATDGSRIVYHVAGEIWRLDSLAADAEPYRLEVQLSAPPAARAPRVITAADHLGELDCDETGQASVVEVRGTIHWLTHADGPARALSVNPAARARLPRILGNTGKVAWVTDAGGGDAIQIAEIEAESTATVRTLTSVDLGNITRLVASPDGTRLAAASHDGRLALVDVESGTVTELAANDDGDVEDVAWSPDSAWLAWAQPGPQPLARIRLARVADGFTVDVTDGRFVDSDPVFTVDGLYLAFLSRRTFDPIYDVHSFDLSFPYGARPYLVPLAAHTLSPFGPLPGGRPAGGGDAKDSPERKRLTVDTDGISSRVVAVPVDESRYYSLAAGKGGLLWLRSPLAGVLGEGTADPEDGHPRPALERFDLRKRESSVLAGEVSWFTVSGDGSRLVIGDGGDVRVAPADRKADNGSSGDVTSVDLTRARFLADPPALWRHAYAEFGRLLRRDFWNPGMSGVDWDGVLDEYRFLLDRVRTSAEFGDLLWEVAGELGTSHAYVYPSGTFSARSALRGQPAAVLGADVARQPDGRWVVERVLPGESSDPRARSPFAAPGVAVREGDEILAVDGRPLDPVYGPWPALAGTHGKPVELTIKPADPTLVPRPPALAEDDKAEDSDKEKDDAAPRVKDEAKEGAQTASASAAASAPKPASPAEPASGPADADDPAGPAAADDAGASAVPAAEGAAAEAPAEAPALEFPATRRVVIVPLYDDRRLRYQDWVAGRRAAVRTRSDGRVGYLHVPDMMGEGWAHLHRDLRAEMGRDALIVDVRGNRGGHTSQLIVEKLARRILGWKIPRHLRPYSYPQEARRGPLVALADEFAGSDGDIVTAAIKSLGLGPVIGARTWGGVVGIDGSGHGLVDGTRITIPRYASWFNEFGWSVENYGVDPDTEVLISPDDWAAGHDPQLEVAVDRALALLEENPRPPLPDPSTGPAKRRPPLPPRP